MTNTDFRVSYVLSDNLVKKEHIISDFFDTALEQIDWFRQKTLSREMPFPNDKQYLEAVSYTENELHYAKENASVEEVAGGFKFSFPIRNSRKDFEAVSEDGRRMWLRQHLDDHFLHYAIPGMLEKSFGWKEKNSEDVCLRFEKNHEAFEKSLDGAYNLKTKTFWIEGE